VTFFALLGGGDNCPVEMVSWDDTQEFIKKLNQRKEKFHYRLPTEAEWEYAARAGSQTKFCFGDSKETLEEYAWFGGNLFKNFLWGKSHPVAKKRHNQWGVHDMHGNVWEWCQDWYGNYPTGKVTDPKGPLLGDCRVLRGGSWGGNAGTCRSAGRCGINPGRRDVDIGFRLVVPVLNK
jgi:formylglycine-generating enzyme required for sulfatase activity